MADTLAEAMVRVFHTEGLDLGALGLAWARVAPAIVLVPAFGLRATPAAFRTALGLLLAASIAPALPAIAPEGPWAGALLRELLRGLPLALSAALPIWIATMTGGVVDALRGAQDGASLPVLDGKQGALGALWSLIACVGFLSSGGPARVAMAAIEPPAGLGALTALWSLSSGVTIAVAVAAPVLGAALLVEVALALVARAATPASLSSVLSIGRGAIVLVLTALLFERTTTLLLTLVAGG